MAELRWDTTIGGPCIVNEDGVTATAATAGTNGAVYSLTPLSEGKWTWTVRAIKATGNCMTVGVGHRKDPSGSGRVTGLHASGNCLDMQTGCGRSSKSFRLPRVQNDTEVKVVLDMNARTMGFVINGEDSGPVVEGLPTPVFPAVDMREAGIHVVLGELEEVLA